MLIKVRVVLVGLIALAPLVFSAGAYAQTWWSAQREARPNARSSTSQGRAPSAASQSSWPARTSSPDRIVRSSHTQEAAEAIAAPAAPPSGPPVYGESDLPHPWPVQEGYQDGYGSQPQCGDHCGCNSCCHRSPQFYGQIQYLLWWVDGDDVPPLVTTSPDAMPRVPRLLFGNSGLNEDDRSGVRAMLGVWLAPCLGLEGEYLGIEEDSEVFDRTSPGDPILARPFFDADTGLPASDEVTFPTSPERSGRSGRVIVDASNDFESAGIRIRHRVRDDQCCGQRVRVDGLLGYRFLSLEDDLVFRTSNTATATSGLIPLGTTLDVHESFRTENEFHGVDLGLVTGFESCCWSLELLGKLSVGNMQRAVIIDGTTRVVVPDTAPVDSEGGLLAQRTNIGRYRNDTFSVIPEVGASLAYKLTPCWNVKLGYHFIQLNDVARAGAQIDTTVNLSQASGGALNGAARPAFVLQERQAWAQGLSIGLECSY